MLALYVSSALTKNISALTPPLLQQFATSHSADAGTFALFVIFAPLLLQAFPLPLLPLFPSSDYTLDHFPVPKL